MKQQPELAKFTPGPFRVEIGSDNKTPCVMGKFGEDGDVAVAVCHGLYGRANAALISVAPDLLELALEMRAALDPKLDPPNYTNAQFVEKINKVLAQISKISS